MNKILLLCCAFVVSWGKCVEGNEKGADYPRRDQTGIDYPRVLAAARIGDDAALSMLFSVTRKVDGLGSELHCHYLLELLKQYGDFRFSTVLAKEPASSRTAVIRALNFAFVTFDKRRGWSIDFPYTYKLTPNEKRKVYREPHI
ncbi:MAG: hypothetical protein QOC70_1540 [Verrucomicrobiota bacterium]|jgi:hypothetical protein